MKVPNAAAMSEKTWNFGTVDGILFARNIVLGRNGKFLHHPGPNEDRWHMDGDALVILTRDGQVSCRMQQVESPIPGRLWFHGEHVVGGPSGLMLALHETGVEFPVYLRWSEAYETFAEQVPFYYSSERKIRGMIPIGSQISLHAPTFVEPESCLPKGEFISVGAYSYCHGAFTSFSQARIGRYCSIAGNTRPFGPAHPIERITTSTFTYDEDAINTAKRYGRDDFRPIPYNQFEAPVVIENDVWIGEGVMIRGGVTIGNGAVVAAGSIVTRNVEPYTIVAGVPARPVKKRFPDHLIERFLKTRWWEYNFVDLPDFYDDPPRFLEELERRQAAGEIQPWTPERIELADTLLHLPPTEDFM